MAEKNLTRRQIAEQALQNPNMQRWLNLISWAEGTEEHGYHTNFGGSRLADLSSHPNKVLGRTKDGITTATGRYQFLGSTFNEQAKKLSLSDFGERSQDLAAIGLVMDRGALQDVLNGDVMKAAYKLRNIWASLPDNPSKNQPHKSHKDVLEKWNSLGGNADPSFVQPDTGLFHMNGQQYDYSTAKLPDAAQHKVPEKILSAFAPAKELTPLSSSQEIEPANPFSQVMKSFDTLNGAMDEMVGLQSEPIAPKANYDEQLAQAFGITPSTAGKIPDYIGEMIKSIYDQTA